MSDSQALRRLLLALGLRTTFFPFPLLLCWHSDELLSSDGEETVELSSLSEPLLHEELLVFSSSRTHSFEGPGCGDAQQLSSSSFVFPFPLSTIGNSSGTKAEAGDGSSALLSSGAEDSGSRMEEDSGMSVAEMMVWEFKFCSGDDGEIVGSVGVVGLWLLTGDIGSVDSRSHFSSATTVSPLPFIPSSMSFSPVVKSLDSDDFLFFVGGSELPDADPFGVVAVELVVVVVFGGRGGDFDSASRAASALDSLSACVSRKKVKVEIRIRMDGRTSACLVK